MTTPLDLDGLKALRADAEGDSRVHYRSAGTDDATLQYMSALGNAAEALIQAAEERDALRGALEPFAEFARKWNAKPLLGIHDDIYSIHAGEDGATLRLSDCRRALAVLESTR